MIQKIKARLLPSLTVFMWELFATQQDFRSSSVRLNSKRDVQSSQTHKHVDFFFLGRHSPRDSFAPEAFLCQG